MHYKSFVDFFFYIPNFCIICLFLHIHIFFVVEEVVIVKKTSLLRLPQQMRSNNVLIELKKYFFVFPLHMQQRFSLQPYNQGVIFDLFPYIFLLVTVWD